MNVYMKKKKGFTLTELLAIIVILAVITLIALQQVLKILNKSRLSSIEDSAYGIVGSAEIYVSNFMLQNNRAYPKERLEFECGNNGCKLKENSENNLSKYDLTNLESINFKGKAPNSGNVSIDPSGKIALNLKFGNHCVYKSYMSSNINILGGDCYENLWFTDIEYPITQNGVTIDYDYDTQIYTLNGTSTVNANYIGVSNKVSYNFNLGDKYIVKIFYIGGNFNRLDVTGNVHVKVTFTLVAQIRFK